jgi:hypothetical protein
MHAKVEKEERGLTDFVRSSIMPSLVTNAIDVACGSN